MIGTTLIGQAAVVMPTNTPTGSTPG